MSKKTKQPIITKEQALAMFDKEVQAYQRAIDNALELKQRKKDRVSRHNQLRKR